jgi:hypothetical protein
MSLVLDRMLRAGTHEAAARSAPVAAPQVFATAAVAAQNSAELEQACSILQGIGLPITPTALFRMMGESLPGWNLQSQGAPAAGAAQSPTSPMLEAMGRIIQFAGSGRESANRWEELVKAAVEQLNQGSPSRAAAMLGLAENVLQENPQDPRTVENLRSVGHQFVDIERLRASVENAQNHPHLKRVMSFFDELKPGSLLRQLESETRRNRRRLILDLLEVHGEAVRAEALNLLELLVAGGVQGGNWHFPRNLVYLLHRVRPSAGPPSNPEFDIVEGFLDPARPASLVKEAITYFGQYRHPRSEECLERFVAVLEEQLTGSDLADSSHTHFWGLLDRAAFALARLGTPRAISVLRVHALKTDLALGNTSARLVHLSSQDIGVDRASVEAIVDAARKALPRKLLGVKVRKGSNVISNLITSLSSTPDPAVRAMMKEISERFPSEEYGQAAVKCLEDLEAASRKCEEGGSRMMGDLDLFGLPGLLQQLERSRASGLLSLKEKNGNVIGELDLLDGRLARANSGRLTGDAAFYRLLEKPAAAAFVFQRRRVESETGGQEPLELAPLIEEGMRRYDEFEWLRVVVPDGSTLKPTGESAPPEAVDSDVGLCESLWRSVTSGSTPADCERLLPHEPLRIRRILSRWLESGLLTEA